MLVILNKTFGNDSKYYDIRLENFIKIGKVDVLIIKKV